MARSNSTAARKRMVREQIRSRGIQDPRVLQALETVPRHLFVDKHQHPYAYADNPLPIAHRQTISQPYIVAFMTEILEIEANHSVLEIGTGCGYQTAILSLLAKTVISLEIIPDLAREAAKRLPQLGYDNVEVYCRDGNLGWPEKAPYDRIMVTAAARDLPEELVRQLAPEGRMIVPVGADTFSQNLELVYKDARGRMTIEHSLPVRFVPLI